MSDSAVFKAAYSDWKLVKTRACVQIIFEIPLHEADLAYQVVGGMPDASAERWFAIAALNAGAKAPAREAPDKRLSQQAGILCNDPIFQKFIRALDAKDAAAKVRSYCGGVKSLTSRADIVPGSPAGAKWLDLESRYQAWRLAPEHAA